MAITFTDKPDQSHIERLRDAGFRWDSPGRAWVKPMDRDQKWKSAVDAERVFHDIGNAIRTAKGLPVEASVA